MENDNAHIKPAKKLDKNPSNSLSNMISTSFTFVFHSLLQKHTNYCEIAIFVLFNSRLRYKLPTSSSVTLEIGSLKSSVIAI